MTNDFIALLKDSSLVSVITVVELTKQMTITAVDVRTWIGPGLTCAALYFAMSYPLGLLARRLEKKLDAIARALAMEPKALLLDEPTAALDPERKAEVIEVLAALAKEGTTMVIVTHEPSVVRGIADVAIALKNGRVVARGTAAEVLDRA